MPLAYCQCLCEKLLSCRILDLAPDGMRRLRLASLSLLLLMALGACGKATPPFPHASSDARQY